MRKVLQKDRTIGARINAQKPLIVNPGTIIDANHSNMPLRMNENNPRVMKVSGRDKTCRIGLIKALTKPMTTAASNAEGKLAMSTPGTIRSTTRSPKAVASMVRRYPIMFFNLVNSNLILMELGIQRFSLKPEP
ncbi:MAG: hypothetical protein AUK48_12935 [Oscillatoriales cyanobacterium CG2_30_44_21]|nr:MAG: hypothetical protein AUK48_12935 [Oscillatoriales cyanobacterium CG2_30_44_21]